MKTLDLGKGLYWTGVLDPDLRVFDIIMLTEFGTTYNSYILKGSKKTALVETAKLRFFDEYLESINNCSDVSAIDYIIVNHTEPDHAGSIEKLLEYNPNVKIVGTSCAIGYLKEIVNRDFYSIAVNANSTLSLGDKTLRFYPYPNLHWPDTMYTYVEEDHVLFTCDSFGSHYSHEGVLRSTVTAADDYWKAAKYYFDCIIGPFKNPYMTNALKGIADLKIDMICPGHGPVLDSNIKEIIDIYHEWCKPSPPNAKATVVIPYVSAYGYTEKLAKMITDGIKDSGDIDVKSFDMVVSDQAMVLEQIGMADGLLFGTPTIVGEALKPIWDLTTSMFAPVHKNKLASAFGSYGWSGEGVPNIIERLKQLKLKVLDGLRIRFKPSKQQLLEAYEFGYQFGCVLLNKPNDKVLDSKQAGFVKCIVCGEILPAGTEICPVCGVDSKNFIPVLEQAVHYKKDTDELFLILGGGTAALNAASAIRERNKTAGIVLLSEEECLPYNRPMLTKNMFAGLEPKEIAIQGKEWFEKEEITYIGDTRVIKINPKEKEVVTERGDRFSYSKCIYALGARGFVPSFHGAELPGVLTIRSVKDIEQLTELLKGASNAVVIGGGVLGLEAAWELKKEKCAVSVLEAAPELMAGKIDKVAADMLKEIAEENGIMVRTASKIEAICGTDRVHSVKLADGSEFAADIVIISCGNRANTSIAQECGIKAEASIPVNEYMETNVDDIYACGDCASFDGKNYGIWPEACEMGRVAGANAAGETKKYEPELPAITFHAMGTALFAIGDNGSDTSKKYKTMVCKDSQKQSVETYYFHNNRLVGATLLGDVTKMAEITEKVKNHVLFQNL